MFQLWSVDGFTGAKVDLLPMAGGSWSRMLSAGGEQCAVEIPVEVGTDRGWLEAVTTPWQRILVIEREGVALYGGFVHARGYTLGGNVLKVTLVDVWGMLARRGAWDRAEAVTTTWQTSLTGTLGDHAWQAVHRGRNTGHYPLLTRFPLVAGSPGGGDVVTRTYYGYHFEMIADVWAGLLDEGLDIFTKPRWNAGVFEWQFNAGPAWSSGRVRELMVSVPEPGVTALSVAEDAARVTNNAIRLGEGSEVDTLARSRQNFTSPFPVLDRVTSAKTITDNGQLDAQALTDLDLYGAPTVQWDFDVPAGTDVDVGDTVRLHVDGDAWIGDGWHERRVVKVSGGLGETFKIGVQPVGGL